MSKMYGLKKSVNGNEGTAVVEATFIIPVVVFIVVAVIFLFLDVINDAVIQGNVYYELYTISNADDLNTFKGELEQKIENEIIGVGNKPNICPGLSSGNLFCEINAKEGLGGKIYRYQGKKINFKREYDKCTDRLRRWQLYGDILWE